MSIHPSDYELSDRSSLSVNTDCSSDHGSCSESSNGLTSEDIAIEQFKRQSPYCFWISERVCAVAEEVTEECEEIERRWRTKIYRLVKRQRRDPNYYGTPSSERTRPSYEAFLVQMGKAKRLRGIGTLHYDVFKHYREALTGEELTDFNLYDLEILNDKHFLSRKLLLEQTNAAFSEKQRKHLPFVLLLKIVSFVGSPMADFNQQLKRILEENQRIARQETFGHFADIIVADAFGRLGQMSQERWKGLQYLFAYDRDEKVGVPVHRISKMPDEEDPKPKTHGAPLTLSHPFEDIYERFSNVRDQNIYYHGNEWIFSVLGPNIYERLQAEGLTFFKNCAVMEYGETGPKSFSLLFDFQEAMESSAKKTKIEYVESQ